MEEMEEYLVSARKYRPTTFASVVGQQYIVTTLKNAIKTNKIAQAFLFYGPRGVGKTTTARIFAKTINCTSLTEDIEPCNHCKSCISFNQSASFNIHELDAASNNSVDDIRALIEQVRIPPQTGKYKVYIIDEAHMLSQAAFNAFLKTLEEPPSYAKFILATTEKHKIPPTILSRCQVFDFKRISVEDIAKHLASIAQQENITFEEQALFYIASKSDGALRDALSIFDQMVSFTSGNITTRDVIENLNILDYEQYFRFIDFILEKNVTKLLLHLDEIYTRGFEGLHVINGLAEHIRTLLFCKDERTCQLIQLHPSVMQQYLAQSQKTQMNFLIQSLDVLNYCDIHYKTVSNKRFFVELTLLKLMQLVTTTNASQNTKDSSRNTHQASTTQNSNNQKVSSPDSNNSSVSNTSKEKSEKNTEKQRTNAQSEKLKSLSVSNIIHQSLAEYSKKTTQNPYSDEDVQNAFEAFKQHIKEQSSEFAFDILSNTKCEKSENGFVITVHSQIEQESIRNLNPQQWIRDYLKNQSFTLEIKVNKQNGQQQSGKTLEVKFQDFLKTNPIVQTFIQDTQANHSI